MAGKEAELEKLMAVCEKANLNPYAMREEVLCRARSMSEEDAERFFRRRREQVERWMERHKEAIRQRETENTSTQ